MKLSEKPSVVKCSLTRTMPPRAVEKKTTSNGEKPAKTIKKSKQTPKVSLPIGLYGLASVEDVKKLPMLPKMAQREVGRLYRKMQKIGNKEVEVVVRTKSSGKYGVLYGHACARCGMRSNEPVDTSGDVLCAKCGGMKQASVGRALKKRRKAKRDVNEPALFALMAEHNVPRAPDNVKDAKNGTTYAKLNQNDSHKPCLVRRKRQGKIFCYKAWCACKGKGGGETWAGECYICVGKRPEGKRDLTIFCSECKRTRVGNGHTICAACRAAPTEQTRARIHKAHVLSDALIRGLHKRGREDLISKITEDCMKGDAKTGVCSGRREDIDLNATPTFNLNTEWSENQHKGSSYTVECERSKYTGQLADRGAPAFTEEEGDLLDCEPTDKQMMDLQRAGRLTDEHVALRKKRRTLVKNMLKRKRKREEEVEAGNVEFTPMKMHTMHFNPDAFRDCNGIRHPSLFRRVPDNEFDGLIRYKPRVKQLEAALEPFLDEMVRVADLASDESWHEAQPHLVVSYWRFNGCHAGGRPVKKPRTLFE